MKSGNSSILIPGFQNRIKGLKTSPRGEPLSVDFADQLTLQYLSAASYDPECWADALYKMVHLKKGDLVRLFDYYNTRPISLSRLKKLKKNLKKMDLRGRTLETGTEAYGQAVKGVRQIYAVAPVA